MSPGRVANLHWLPLDPGLLSCLQSGYWGKFNSSKKLPLGKPLPAHMTDKEYINLRKWLLAGSGQVLEAGTKGVLLCLAQEQPHGSGIDHVFLLCHRLGVVGWQADGLQNRGAVTSRASGLGSFVRPF